MNKTSIITALLALATMAGQAREKMQVWEHPTTEYGNVYGDGYFNLAFDVTRVELKEDETVVYATVMLRSDYQFQFVSGTYLKAGYLRYALKSADGIELDKYVHTGRDGRCDIVFHFQPLPQGTRSFDFIEGDGERAFQIKGIKPVEERWKQLFPSYWRDENGDWKIAFFEDCAIYDCRFWTYKRCGVNPKTGEADIVMSNAGEELHVKVGKNKKGTRAIQIGGHLAAYSMITSRFLPDYPTKDTRTDFVDTGYATDTVTVVGWIKDFPEKWGKKQTFEFAYEDFLTDKQESAYADLDSLGRFMVKVPVLNSTEFFGDWKHCFLRTMFEPGKTYFLLYDFKEGRRFFMGNDARLQNELFKYPLDWESLRMAEGGDFDQYIASVDSLLKAQYAYIDDLCEAHPSLSTRFRLYRRGNTFSQQAGGFGQARFNSKDFQFPESARRYAYDTFWTQMERPYTLHRDLCGFLRDYLDDARSAHARPFTWNPTEYVQELVSNDEERALVNRWKDGVKEANEAILQATTLEDKQRLADEFNARNAELNAGITKILNGPKATRLFNEKYLLARLKTCQSVLDSLGADPFIRDMRLTQTVVQELDQNRASLSAEVLDTLRAMVANPECIAMVERQNDHYIAIENREFDRLVLKSSDSLAGISEGEALLQKILEPYKGRFVLLDVWGTWCGPCKEALSHSAEEYARLKDFDIEFLYLANNSPQESWENVIKMYEVTGDNVAHYNLPREQQAAIERYLDVHSFPTYKLFDREGRLLDIKVDARQLDDLVRLLKQLKGEE